MLYYIYNIPLDEIVENDYIAYRKGEKGFIICIFYIVNINRSFRSFKEFKKNDWIYYNTETEGYKRLT